MDKYDGIVGILCIHNPPDMFVSRAEHVGSLKRPAILLKKRADFEEGRCTAKEIQACEDESIAAAVRLQLDIGLTTITDGEFRR